MFINKPPRNRTAAPRAREPGRPAEPLPARARRLRQENTYKKKKRIHIDLEAIQNKDVQIVMDNFNIHSLYN